MKRPGLRTTPVLPPTWALQPLKTILRRGLKANAFDRSTNHGGKQGAELAVEEEESEAIIVLSSPLSLPSPIAPTCPDVKAMEALHLVDAACQVDGDDTTKDSPPPSAPPSPQSDDLNETGVISPPPPLAEDEVVDVEVTHFTDDSEERYTCEDFDSLSLSGENS